jgi:YD repeat-containing protein
MTTDPTGVRQFLYYDAMGRKTAQVDGTGTLTEFVYNGTGDLIETIQYAGAVDTSSLVDESGEFIEVVETLWVYCRIGADHAGFPFPEPSDTGNDNAKHKKIVTDAYDVRNANDELSGDLIKAKLANWAEWEELTNVCAFDCGYNAAWAARDMDKTELDPEAYRMGYRQTERRMKSQMNRVRRYNKIWGRPEMENLQLQRGGGC